ncbi:lipopolysaccharide biosynthesis protein [Cryobacterium sp. W22_MBD10_FK3]|uniref:lipopolysaccharide biosynthesis protein n=1 Tax=Cryobacterium sp. W22_MBD10_FK3 TaxID=3240273 RepID=UPI003F8DEA36
MTSNTSAARGVSITLVGQLSRFLIQLTALVWLSRLLSPNDFGLVAMVAAVAGVATIIGDGGLSFAAVQAKTLTDQQRTNLFWSNLLLGAVLGTVIFSTAAPLSDFYDSPDLENVAKVIAVVFLLNGATTQFRAHINRSLNFRLLALTDVSSQFVGLVVAVSAALIGLGFWALVFQQLVVALVALVFCAMGGKWKPGLPRRAAGMRRLYAFGIHTLLDQILNYASVNLATVLLGRSWGPSVVGVYSRAYNIFTMPMTQLASPLTRVALPLLSRIEDRRDFTRRLTHAQTLLAYPLLGIFSTLAVVAPSLIPIALGPGWHDVVPILQVLSLGGAFQVLAYVYYWAFLALGKTGVQLRFSVPTRVAMMGFCLIGVQWGAIGVACAITAGLIVIWIVNSSAGMRAIGISSWPLIRASARPFISWAFIFLAVWLLNLMVFDELINVLQLTADMATIVALLGLLTVVPAIRRDFLLIFQTLLLLVRPEAKQDATSATVNAKQGNLQDAETPPQASEIL